MFGCFLAPPGRCGDGAGWWIRKNTRTGLEQAKDLRGEVQEHLLLTLCVLGLYML